MRKIVNLVWLAHAEQLHKRFELAFTHPCRSLFYMHAEGLTDLLVLVWVALWLTGHLHITFS